MSRSTHWHCKHGMQWHKCAEHRTDPEEHHTTRAASSMTIQEISNARLLPSDRPEPISKKMRVSRARANSLNRKRVVQSANPTNFNLNWSKCPKLALKFPHLYSAHCAEDPDFAGHTESSTSQGMSDVHDIRPTTGAICSVVDWGAVTGSSTDALKHSEPTTGASRSAAEGVPFFTTAATCAFVTASSSPVRQSESERSHCREGDLRSDL